MVINPLTLSQIATQSPQKKQFVNHAGVTLAHPESRGNLMRWLPVLTIALMLPLAACATTRPATYLVETKGPYQLDTGDTVGHRLWRR